MRKSTEQILLALALIVAPVSVFTSYEATVRVTTKAPTSLGDMSRFERIVSHAQALASAGDLAGAQSLMTEYKAAWDNAESTLRPRNQRAWTAVDNATDFAFTSIRTNQPELDQINVNFSSLMKALKSVSTPAT